MVAVQVEAFAVQVEAFAVEEVAVVLHHHP